jgi:hypothetical protein
MEELLQVWISLNNDGCGRSESTKYHSTLRDCYVESYELEAVWLLEYLVGLFGCKL